MNLGALTRRGLLAPRYWSLWLRLAWFRLRNPHVVVRGPVFLAPGSELYCRRGLGHMEIGRWV